MPGIFDPIAVVGGFGGTVTRVRHRLAGRYSQQRALVDSALATLDSVRIGASGVNTVVLYLRDAALRHALTVLVSTLSGAT